MPAPSTSTGWDLTALAFVAGFAIATLIFWPLLQRAHERKRTDEPRNAAEHDGTQRRGKHALGKPAPRRAEPSKVGHAVPQQSTGPANGTTAAETGSAEPSAEQPPVQDLFEQLHGPKFDHFHTRIARLRAELEKH